MQFAIKTLSYVFGAVVFAAIVVGCTLDDSQRCPDGYEYDSNSLACFKDEPQDTNTISDTSSNDSTTDDLTGLGDECTSSEDCVGPVASYCVINPLTQAGYCTIENCESGDCPSGYSCCDCTGIEGLDAVSCVTQTDAGSLTTIAKCTCE